MVHFHINRQLTWHILLSISGLKQNKENEKKKLSSVFILFRGREKKENFLCFTIQFNLLLSFHSGAHFSSVFLFILFSGNNNHNATATDVCWRQM